MEFWGHHRHIMGPIPGDESAWQCTKVGPGPIPIKTDEGWLLIYHGVITTCNGFVYRIDVPNVTFPCAALTDADTGRIAIYYGCADTVTGMAFTTVDELLAAARR